MKTIINQQQLSITIDRLCHQLIENHLYFKDTILIGLQPRGVFLSDRIDKRLKAILPQADIAYGRLDITFYRDDFNKKGEMRVPNKTDIDFSIENKKVVLIDDVLYTGRTVRSALEALLDFGRPDKVELLVLIDRRFSRQIPIQPDYTGRSIDSIISQKVKVQWEEQDGEDKVVLID